MNICFRRQPLRTVYRISLLVVAGLLWTLTAGFAQSRGGRGLVSFGRSSGLASDTLYLDVNQDIAVQLLPFDELVKMAVAYSPVIKYQNEVSSVLKASQGVARTQILQNVSGFGNYSGGNQVLIASGRSPDLNTNPIGQIANGYRAGVELRVSLFDVFGRKHLIRQADANYKASLVQKDIAELELKQQLISIYQDMITAQQILKTRLIDEQASLAALRVAEAELQKGKITTGQLASATTAYVQAKATTEQVKGDFLKSVHLFEALMGTPIQRLKRY
ncbi:hypothetical protein EQG79_08530 [Spirosoma sordidisoli]|uniref:TolC family protein n=1 Tax=Spirosoma sordidisoli TaxID=2502893 RepID=A0A4Q2UWB9_9BACT|nr:hypothetical protein EQG79_08530 [Spirosoma sordidisoli]